MVYGFVRQSGGHIVVDSEVGIGTTVKLFLPRAVGEGARDDAVEAAVGTHASSGETILVVEDDARVRRIAASILRKSGYRVLEATDAKEAMAVVEGTPQIDLLFTDVLLPNGIDGTQLARQVVVRRPDTRILFTSGYASEIAADVADLGRPADLLPKPYRRNDLTRKVREVLDHAPPAAAPPPAPQPPPAAST
jgi:CheY-like chemotaxis protein